MEHLSMVCSTHTPTPVYKPIELNVYMTNTHTHTHTHARPRYLHFANVRGGCHGMAGEGDLSRGVIMKETDEKGYRGLSHFRVALFIMNIKWVLRGFKR